MANKQLLEAYKLVIQALAEKYEVSTAEVGDMLGELPGEALAGADWKDLDAIVQEGLVAKGGPETEYGTEFMYRGEY